MAKCGRKPVLDGYKRREILAIVAAGCKREVAAEYVGCDLSTIYRTAQRDADFAEKLRQKELSSEIGYLQNLRKAAQQERYWRAAAWALERINPDKYGRRGPEVITVDQIRALMAQFSEVVVEEVPARHRKNILKRLAAISDALKGASKNKDRRR